MIPYLMGWTADSGGWVAAEESGVRVRDLGVVPQQSGIGDRYKVAAHGGGVDQTLVAVAGRSVSRVPMLPTTVQLGVDLVPLLLHAVALGAGVATAVTRRLHLCYHT